MLLVTALWPALSHWFDQANHRANPVLLTPIAVNAPALAPFNDWQPAFMKADAALRSVTRAADGGVPVALHVLFYRNQQAGKLLISSSNVLAQEEDVFHAVGASMRSETLAGTPLTLRETRMSGPGGSFLVWQWYWIDGQRTASSIKGKLLQARAKLLLHGDGAAAIVLAAPYTDNQPERARAALQAYLAANGRAIDGAIEAANAR
ncbi:exosortase C-terminal domain/associated protein EpsI [Massilia sp. DWR3-1-1]|uniref:exosortase C-terminal domain/associated protein EpsI n=1 Tax=Massilia sp. DWR3-1-1 TaxID=2804559 RepID=UPI003CE6F13A